MKIYHQLGFRENWNYEVLKKGIGNGFIFSPVNLPEDKLMATDISYKKISFFDPQCYFPENTPKGKLTTYKYFPQNICKEESCSTQVIMKDESCKEIAEKCIELQLKNEFEYIVIPFKRYLTNNSYEMITKNETQFVKPFLEVVKDQKIKTPLLLTVVLNQDQLKFAELRDEILNWITSFKKIKGIYLIFQYENSSKQIKDSDFLLSALKFIDILKKNGLKVIIGYTNTEALLYSLAMPDGVTIGSYENLRKFSVNRFIENDTMARGPIARLYSPVLLNWIPAGIVNSIRQKNIDEFDRLFPDDVERPYHLSGEFNWHFTKPELYKYYFIQFFKQISLISNLETKQERIEKLKEIIVNAVKSYKGLDIKFDADSNYDHLAIWAKVILEYEKLN